MIALSRLRLSLISLAIFVGALACDHACGLIGCRQGLLITLDDTFEKGKTYDVVISELTTTPETVPLVTCIYVVPSETTAVPTLSCTSTLAHAELGSTIQVRDWMPAHISVKVSSGGAVLAEKTIDPKFVGKELNGPGCGTCTNAAVTMSLP